MEKHQTEDVYDEEIYPLVAQIIEIAKRAKIPLFISAGTLCVVDGELDPTTCATLVTHGEEGAPELKGMENRHALCLEIVRGHSGFDTASAMMITRHRAP